MFRAPGLFRWILVMVRIIHARDWFTEKYRSGDDISAFSPSKHGLLEIQWGSLHWEPGATGSLAALPSLAMWPWPAALCAQRPYLYNWDDGEAKGRTPQAPSRCNCQGNKWFSTFYFFPVSLISKVDHLWKHTREMKHGFTASWKGILMATD